MQDIGINEWWICENIRKGYRRCKVNVGSRKRNFSQWINQYNEFVMNSRKKSENKLNSRNQKWIYSELSMWIVDLKWIHGIKICHYKTSPEIFRISYSKSVSKFGQWKIKVHHQVKCPILVKNMLIELLLMKYRGTINILFRINTHYLIRDTERRFIVSYVFGVDCCVFKNKSIA